MSGQARAVVLLSGGLDSATALAVARAEGFVPYAMSVRYGQRHALEWESARRMGQALGVAEHEVVDIDLRAFGSSALTGEAEMPRGPQRRGDGEGIPVTYVRVRNTMVRPGARCARPSSRPSGCAATRPSPRCDQPARRGSLSGARALGAKGAGDSPRRLGGGDAAYSRLGRSREPFVADQGVIEKLGCLARWA
jgi:hypothetical protein